MTTPQPMPPQKVKFLIRSQLLAKQTLSVLNCFSDLRLYRVNTGDFNRCIYYCSALDGNTGEMMHL